MYGRYTAHVRRLIEAVLRDPGETNFRLRSAVEARAAQLGGRASLSQPDPLPAEVECYTAKVAQHAYRIEDRDIEALRAAGYSEDAIFEMTLSAALGAGIARLEVGLNALRGDRHATQDH
jgi:alkylhydroperoxidase family enzyme